MCQHVVILAERNGQQYVSQCEHGTVHLIWDGIGLHLPAEAFNRLVVQIMNTRANILELGDSISQGHCRLGVGNMSLTLPVEDFLLMVEMIDEVMPQVNLTGSGQNHPSVSSRAAPSADSACSQLTVFH